MYEIFAPAPLLSPYIELYWRVQTNDAVLSLHERIMVDGQADILFNFGAPYQRQNPTDASGNGIVSRSNLDAQRRYPIIIAQQGAIDLIGVRFRSGGLNTFTRIPLMDFTNLTLDLDLLFGTTVHELEESLFEARLNAEHQIALLNAFFLRLRRDPSYAHQSAYQLASMIDSTNGSVTIAALSREIGYSMRTLDRRFTAAFGFSPKFYARIARFRATLNTLDTRTKINLGEIALLHGYSDQAHFTNDFVMLAGQTPSQYLTMRYIPDSG
ncbi:MAG: AraC family transcriptional regulator [Chitinophagaceae bacterium]|nr:AraC family transcriptional regulator [Anaerolineae bacterium]